MLLKDAWSHLGICGTNFKEWDFERSLLVVTHFRRNLHLNRKDGYGIGRRRPLRCGPAFKRPTVCEAVEASTAFYAAKNASQDGIPWASQFTYGHYVTYYWVGIAGVLGILHYFTVIREYKSWSVARHGERSPSLLMLANEARRYIYYRHPSRVWRYLMLASVGMATSWSPHSSFSSR